MRWKTNSNSLVDNNKWVKSDSVNASNSRVSRTEWEQCVRNPCQTSNVITEETQIEKHLKLTQRLTVHHTDCVDCHLNTPLDRKKENVCARHSFAKLQNFSISILTYLNFPHLVIGTHRLFYLLFLYIQLISVGIMSFSNAIQ